jgi:hypothetical protein
MMMAEPNYVPARQVERDSTGEDVKNLYAYLKRFGYFPNQALEVFGEWRPAVTEDVADPEVFDEVMERAVVLYQGFNGLKPDGVVGPKTISRMRQVRCGNPDVVRPNDNLDEFAVQGSRWLTNDLRYCFDNSGKDLSAQDVRIAMSGALERWSLVSPLRFTEVDADAEADIHIGWHTADHGDGSPFDNGGAANRNVLAHCFFPPPGGGEFAGDCHFDEFENWTVDTPPTGIDLATVALHELGHGLGLRHSSVPSAVMFASYDGARRELTRDDIDGIRAIYGS